MQNALMKKEPKYELFHSRLNFVHVNMNTGRPLGTIENLEALLVALKKAKPSSAKGVFIKKVSISTTMGAGVAVDQASLEAQA